MAAVIPFTKTYEIDISTRFPEFPYAKSFTRIQQVLDSKEIVDDYLGQMEQAINDSLEENSGYEYFNEAIAMYNILRNKEDAHGFVKDQVKYVTGVLQPKEFFDMMEGPYAFLDPFVTPRHGAETHRLQWWIIASDIEADTDRIYYDEPVTAGQLFKSTSTAEAKREKKNDNVWYHSLDALQGECNTGRAPESFKAYFMGHFPRIANAEAMQMKWDDCCKWRWAVVKESWASRVFERNQELVPYESAKGKDKE